MTAVSMGLSHVTPVVAASSISRSEYEACQTQDETAFRTAIENITRGSLTKSLQGLDYESLVYDEWNRIRLGEILDKSVDKTVAEVQSETSWASKIRTLTDSEKAKELAVTVAERVYRSSEVKNGIEALAVGVGSEAGKRIELATQDAAGPAVRCLKSFLGPRYGTTVAAIVAGKAGDEFGLRAPGGETDVSSEAVLRQSSEGITGAAILIVRRQLANMATRVGQRLVGSILSRLVSVVAGGVGLVLIAKDIWELRNGVLPIIAEEMKTEETKKKVREELAQALSSQIGEHVDEIGTKSAERLIEIWHEFQQAHAKVLGLAGQSEKFRTFLDSVPPDRLPRLDEVTSLVLSAEGEAGIANRLTDGTLDEAVRDLPDAAVDIARQTRSLETAMKWWALAPESTGEIIRHEIFRRASPEDFTKPSLERLLAIGDPLAIKRLAGLDRSARDILFEREPGELGGLARNHSEAELTALASYLSRLPSEPRERILSAVVSDPTAMGKLAAASVQKGIIESHDTAAAIDMVLGAGSGTANVLLKHLHLVWTGRVAPELLWVTHPYAVGGLALAFSGLLLLIFRLLRPRRKAAPAA